MGDKGKAMALGAWGGEEYLPEKWISELNEEKKLKALLDRIG